MVAYSFQKRFVEAIEADEKRQTIRGNRKRHARPGEVMQLYTGMRTKRCRLVGLRKCLSVDSIAISLEEERVVVSHIAAAIGADHWNTFDIAFSDDGPAYRAKEITDKDAFAVADGFAGWRSMREFWRLGEPDPKNPSGWWVGVMIRWLPSEAYPGRKDTPPRIAAELDAVGVR